MRRALLAEWTKLRTVRRWVIALGFAVLLIIGLSVLGASGSSTDANKVPDFVVGPAGTPVADELRMVHQPVNGDATMTVRVTEQTARPADARAGLVLKQEARTGSRYAALYVTPGQGVRLEANFGTAVRGSTRTAPVWLRLVRSGSTVTGYESADGTAWQQVGTVTVPGLAPAARIGFFVASPPERRTERSLGSVGVGESSTESTATFTEVRVEGGTPDASWTADELVMHPDQREPKEAAKPGEGTEEEPPFTEEDGAYTVVGSGEIGPKEPPDDVVELALVGILGGLMALVAVAALFVTSEFRHGLIRTTFAAMPARGRTLAAKAVVVAVVSFVVGIVGGAVALVAAQPLLQDGGFGPPAFPPYSLTDGHVLRTLGMSALFLAALGVFTVGLGAVLRHSAAVITVVLALVVLPVIIGSAVPVGPARWLMLLTPAGGLATWRSKPATDELATPWALLSPGVGLTVVVVYAAAAMLAAWWLLRKRDA